MTAIADAPRRIELDDVTALGNVDDALGDFYVEQIAAAAATSGVPQRVIREWFEDQLISAQGFRTQVLDGPGHDGPVVLRELEDAHLIRADSRRGAQWYEISHDRLVAPILASNAAWRARHLSALQVDARAWDRAARPAGLLIGGEVLASAEAWANANPDGLLPVDRDYLDACRAAEVQIVAIQRAARRNRILAIAASALLLLAVVGLLVALLFWRSATESADEARIARDDAQQSLKAAEDARTLAEEEAQRAEEEAQRAEEEAQRAEQESQRAEQEAQRASAEEIEANRQKTIAGDALRLSEKAKADLEVAVFEATSAEGSARSAEEAARQAEGRAATEAANANRAASEARTSDALAQREAAAAVTAQQEAVTLANVAKALANTANSERLGLLASSLISSDSQLAGLLALESDRVVSTEMSRQALLSAARALSSNVTKLNGGFPAVVSSSGHTAESSAFGGLFVSFTDFTLWSRQFEGEATITSMEFNSAGSQLAVAATDRTIEVVCPCGGNEFVVQSTIHVLDVATGSEVHTLPSAVGPLEFSPDGRWLLASGARFDLASADPSATRIGQSSMEWPEEARFSPDGTTLATYLALFGHISIEGFPPSGETISLAPDDPIGSFDAFVLAGPNRFAVASSSTIQVRDRPFQENVCTLDGHLGQVVSLLFSTDGLTLYSGARDATIRSWDLTSCRQTGVIAGYLNADIVRSTDGTAIVMNGQRGTTIIPTLEDTSVADLRTVVRDNLSRTLTAEEQARYLIE